MNESAAKSLRGAPAQQIDISAFEERLRGPQPRSPDADPLVELATLVNSAEDPFRDLFAPQGAEPAHDYAPPPARPARPVPAARPPAPLPYGARPPAPAYAPPVAADPRVADPDDAAAMLRTYADKMRQPAASAPAQDFGADEFYGIPSLAARPGSPAPAPAAYSREPDPRDAAPADNAPAAIPTSGYASAAPPHHAPPSPPALRGSLPPLPEANASQEFVRQEYLPEENDPVDEFERSIAQLVASRTASVAPAHWDHAPAAPSGAALQAPAPGQWQDEWREAVPGEQAEYAQAAGWPNETEASARPAVPPEWLDDAGVPPPPPAAMGQSGRRSRKAVYLAGAGMAVFVVGIAAALGIRPSGSTGGSVPTITAATEKLKVKAEDGGAVTKPVRSVSILQPNNSGAKSSNVVTNDEQPVDLAQVPAEPKAARRIKEEELSRKLNLADKNVAQPIASRNPAIGAPRSATGYFPEPRKVRTVMVRPDGSLIDPTASVPSAGSAMAPAPSRPVRPVALPSVPEADEATPAERPAIAPPRQKAAAPKAAPKTTSRVAARPAPRPARAAPAPREGAAARPTPANRTAAIDLTPKNIRNRATSSAAGGYAVQLAAPAQESAARQVAGNARQRYAAVLGGRSPSIQKAVVGNRTVYRVRVNGLSREAAAKMCSGLQSRGGKCFVARN